MTPEQTKAVVKMNALDRLQALNDSTPESHEEADRIVVEFLGMIGETEVSVAYLNAKARCNFEHGSDN